MSAADSTRKSAGPARSVSGFIVGIFTRNLVSKVAALALAVLVWITVRQDLTRTESFEAIVVTKLGEDITLLEAPPATVEIELEGPTSDIEELRRDPEKIKIILAVEPDDLGKNLIDSKSFSVDRGNIEHNFGEHVRITNLKVGTIRLEVGVEAQERKPVARPTLIGLPEDWEARFEFPNPEVVLLGPKAALDRITEVETTPIAANLLLDGIEGNEDTIPQILALSDATLAQRIKLVGRDWIDCEVTLTRSLFPEEFVVPFTVFIEDADWPVVPEIHETQLVKRAGNDGFTVRLTLKGSPTDLTRVKEALAAGRVRAYVRAMDLSSYAQKAGGRENANVHLELPMELWDRVTLVPPPREDIDISILMREKKPEDNE